MNDGSGVLPRLTIFKHKQGVESIDLKPGIGEQVFPRGGLHRREANRVAAIMSEQKLHPVIAE